MMSEDELLDLLTDVQILVNIINDRYPNQSKWNAIKESLMNYYDFLNTMFINS
jgi:hypothetical protein